jgi:ABC-type antimicrobial peptide transport system permease subunit
VIGVGLTLILGPFASDAVPQFVLYTKPLDIAFVAIVTVIMAAIAAFIPVRRLATIDPVQVFKA